MTPGWDAAEAERLYDSLERDVIPEFYARDENGIPKGLGSPDAGEHGAINPTLLRRSHRARIH